jgi:hypothetical protein
MTKRSHSLRWLRISLIVVAGAAVFVAGAFIHGAGSVPLVTVAKVSAPFAALGLIFGAAFALDGRSDLAVADMPRLRTFLSAAFGAAAVLAVWSWIPGQLHLAWLSAGALLGAVLGWYGWRWAQHVDF